jgi:hypothetical protein
MMHPDVNGQDLVSAPWWHVPSDEHSTTAHFVAGACQGLDCVAYALFGESMCCGDAAVDALVRCSRREPFGRVVGREVSRRKQLEFRALENARRIWGPDRDENRPAGACLEPECDAHAF